MSKEDSPKTPAPKRVKRMTTPQLRSGHDCIFVDDIPEHLPTECSVCLCVLEDPQLVDCSCGAHYCKPCIEPIKAAKKPCPLCKGSFNTIILDRHLQRTMNSLKVYCPFKESDPGCKWVGELKKVPEHLNYTPNEDNRLEGCLYQLLDCVYCKGKFQRRFLVKHEKERCEKRLITCGLCGEYKSTIDDVTKNHAPQCTSRLVPCPNRCRKFVPSKSINKHLETDCLFQVVDCVFSYAGCKERLLRKDMERHVGQSLAYHLSLQAVCHRETMEKQASMQKEIDDLKEQLESKTSRLEDKLFLAKDDVEEMKSQQELLHTHVGIIPIRLILNNYIAKRKAKEVWHSRPFYSSYRGHKMCLVVYTNGRKGGEGTHLSVYIRLLSGGDFVFEVKWPFKGSVFINLMDQLENDDHWVEGIDFDGEGIPESSPVVLKGSRDSEWGMDKFICLDSLCPNYYNLTSDSLHFEITNVSNNDDCCIM